MDDTDDRDDTGGTGRDRSGGRTDQLRIVGAEEAAARAGTARRGGRDAGPGSVTSPAADDTDDELASLRGPMRRSAFDSIPDAPPSFLDDLVADDDPTGLAPPSALGGARAATGPGPRAAADGEDDPDEQPELFSADLPPDEPTTAFDLGDDLEDNDRTDDEGYAEEYAEDGDDLVAASDPSRTAVMPRREPAGPGGAGDEPTVATPVAQGRPGGPDDDDDLGPADGEAADELLADDDEPWPDEDEEADLAERPTRAGRPAEVDPNRFGAVPVIRVGPVEADSEEGIELPHWTEPPTGQVPRVLVDEDRREDDSWSTYGSAPRWRDPSSEWAASDYSDVSDLGDDLPRVGALDEGERPSLDEFFSFEDIDSGSGRSERATGESTTPPARARGGSEPRAAGGPPSGEHPTGGVDAGRDVPIAIGAGLGLAVLFIVLLRVGPAATLALVTLLVAVAAAELMATTRRAGHHPAALVGLAAAAGLPLAVYWRGEAAYPLVLFLAVAFSLFWFLFGVETERPAQNVGLTLLAVTYVGLFGSFAALMLRLGSPLGTNMLLAVTIPTVAADIGAFVVGRNAGRSPLTPISPSKTVEGALGGFAAAVTASVILNHFLLDLSPFDGLWDSAMLGVVVGIVSLLGDLCESLLKRSLGVKDMGTIIPGHGGVLDRMDALLFVLPTAYYLALLLDLIPA